jgi:4-amino-4-deoxy-L-arabinose transferase-like glycosyltransferase
LDHQTAPEPTGSSPAQSSRRGIVITAVCLTAIAVSFALMFTNLDAKPFWVDEAIAVLPAQSILTQGVPRNPFDLDFISFQLEDGIWDPSAPLYRYTVAAVAALFGFSETTTRGWSVLLALVSLVPCYWLFRRLDGAWTALVAVALLAASPHFAETAREARHFTFVGCMMAFTLYFLAAASEGSERARALWPVFLLATLSGHAIGYLALPIVLAFVAASWPRPLLARRYAPLYGILLAAYVALQAKYGNTLPFLHTIGCHNHSAGCHPQAYYYPALLLAFLTGAGIEPVPGQIRPTALLIVANALVPVTLLLVGLAVSVARIRRGGASRPSQLLVMAWFLLPVLLLSTRDVKFPRYLFYVMPPLWFFVARGLVAATSWRGWGRVQGPLLACAAVIVMLAPNLRHYRTAHGRRLGLESRYLEHALDTLAGEKDNWEKMRAQVLFLRANARPRDVVVSSLDDASLGYYLGRFVYGFLNSEHRDAFFMNLLAEAAQRGGRVWFVDTLPNHNYCHMPGEEAWGVDCRLKYRRFYAACLPGDEAFDPTCVRLKFD